MAAHRVVLLEAPGGFGKTTVASRLAERLDVALVRVDLHGPTGATELVLALQRALRRAGLTNSAAAAAPEDPEGAVDSVADTFTVTPPLLLFDEAHRLSTRAAAWVNDLIDAAVTDVRIVVSGRLLPGELDRAGTTPHLRLGPADLAFDHHEIRDLLSSYGAPATPDAVGYVLAATHGWPAATALAATALSRLGPEHPGRGPAPARSALRLHLDRLLYRAGPRTRALAELLRPLPLLSQEVLTALDGDDALDRLLESGLPLTSRPDGWLELPHSVREELPDATIPAGKARAVASAYTRGGEPAEAVTLLLRVGDPGAALRLVAQQRREALLDCGLPLLDRLVGSTSDDLLLGEADALVALVRAAHQHPQVRDAWLARSAAVPAGTPAGRALAAERAMVLARAGDLEGAGRCADSAVAGAGPGETVTVGRAHLARAYCLLVSDTAGATSDASAELEAAAVAFRLAGERPWEADAYQALGYGCQFTSGLHEAAIASLRRVLALRSAPDADRAQSLTFLAEVLVHVGNHQEAGVLLRESRTIARRLGDDRSIAYAAWSLADLAAQRGETAGALAALEEAEAHPGGWMDGLAGVDFLSHAAEIRIRVGDLSGARATLVRAETRAAGTVRADVPLAARVRWHLIAGDAEEALALLDRLEASPVAYRADRWLRVLLRAAAQARLGHREAADELLARAVALCADAGDPGRLERREPQLLELARAATGPAEPASSWRISLLGRFVVEAGDRDVSPPTGRPATLVKLLAVRGAVASEEAVDVLWPGCDEATGRARLRNLMHRLRAVCGDIVIRSDGMLRLAPGVLVDAARFEAEAAAALTAPAEERAARARGALAWWTGELLAGDRYADWATRPREQMRRRRLDLLDLVAADALDRWDLEEATRLLDEAIAEDPLEEERYVTLAGALMRQGRRRAAADVVRGALQALRELDLPPGPELSELADALSATGEDVRSNT